LDIKRYLSFLVKYLVRGGGARYIGKKPLSLLIAYWSSKRLDTLQKPHQFVDVRGGIIGSSFIRGQERFFGVDFRGVQMFFKIFENISLAFLVAWNEELQVGT